jgi:hypothetical protein
MVCFSFPPRFLKAVVPFHRQHDATRRSLARTSKNPVKGKFREFTF